MDNAYSAHMEKLTSNMEKLNGSIADGFALMRQMMCPTQSMMQSQYMAPPQAQYMVPHVPSPNTSPTGTFTHSMYPNDDSHMF